MALPRYTCHKTVQAAKILKVDEVDVEFAGVISAVLTLDGGGVPTDGTDGTIRQAVMPDWYARHLPKAGGYYVVYDDGYASFSPAAPFEAGYHLEVTPQA